MYIVRMEGLQCKDYIGRITLEGLHCADYGGGAEALSGRRRWMRGHVAPSVQEREVAAGAVIN